jgi:NAD(P)-dependent dehydrogenase (short-subunit alcohol dehydrogenase family)
VKLSFEGRCALISGGGSGIGRELAVAFARAGADVAVLGRRLEPLRETCALIEALGRRACAAQCDVKELAQCEAAVEACVRALGRLDVLVNNAGANFLSPAAAISQHGWATIVGVVLGGSFHLSKAAFPHLWASGRGRIVNVSATNAEGSSPLMAPSGAAKAGVHSLSQTLAVEWAPFGITVNCVSPGPVDTQGANSRLWADRAVYERVAATAPLGKRMATPADVVGPVLFLASDAAAFVTGANLIVDGGARLRQLTGELSL